jgi:hypothetical protein
MRWTELSLEVKGSRISILFGPFNCMIDARYVRFVTRKGRAMSSATKLKGLTTISKCTPAKKNRKRGSLYTAARAV